MLKYAAATVALLVCAFVVLSFLHGRSLRHASLIGGMNRLRVAYSDYAERGHVTNYPTSGYRVWLSTNVAIIGGTEYRCFVEIDGGWGMTVVVQDNAENESRPIRSETNRRSSGRFPSLT